MSRYFPVKCSSTIVLILLSYFISTTFFFLTPFSSFFSEVSFSFKTWNVRFDATDKLPSCFRVSSYFWFIFWMLWTLVTISKAKFTLRKTLIMYMAQVTWTNRVWKWEYRDSLRVENGKPICFEIMKSDRYTLHCKSP